jgi:hypothetical protein
MSERYATRPSGVLGMSGEKRVTWTNEIPPKEGYYWWRKNKDEDESLIVYALGNVAVYPNSDNEVVGGEYWPDRLMEPPK